MLPHRRALFCRNPRAPDRGRFQWLEAEPRCGQPVFARHVEQISRSRTVSRQKHRPNQEAALCERIGQVAHRERHVGHAVQEENTPDGALVRRRCASLGGRPLEGHRSGEFQTCNDHAVRFHFRVRNPRASTSRSSRQGAAEQTDRWAGLWRQLKSVESRRIVGRMNATRRLEF